MKSINYQDPATIERLDAWRAKQSPPPTRTSVIREAIKAWLDRVETATEER